LLQFQALVGIPWEYKALQNLCTQSLRAIHSNPAATADHLAPWNA
jgi:hypothetical protein